MRRIKNAKVFGLNNGKDEALTETCGLPYRFGKEYKQNKCMLGKRGDQEFGHLKVQKSIGLAKKFIRGFP